MGCGKSKQAVAIVDNAAVLSRKKSSCSSQSLRDVERNNNVTAGTNENIPTNNDNGNKSNGNDSINTSNNGNVASGVKQEAKKNANGSSDVNASGDDVKIEAKKEEVQEESREGKDSNKSEEVIALDNDDKKEDVIVIIQEKSEYEGKSDEKFESDIPSNGAPKEDSVAENVQVDDTTVEEEKNGGENKEVANEDAGMEKEIKEQVPETDTASNPDEKVEDKPQPEI